MSWPMSLIKKVSLDIKKTVRYDNVYLFGFEKERSTVIIYKAVELVFGKSQSGVNQNYSLDKLSPTDPEIQANRASFFECVDTELSLI